MSSYKNSFTFTSSEELPNRSTLYHNVVLLRPFHTYYHDDRESDPDECIHVDVRFPQSTPFITCNVNADGLAFSLGNYEYFASPIPVEQ